MRAFTALVSLLFVAGCASQIMEGYVGQNLDRVVARYGMPTGAYDTGDGRRAFVFNDSVTDFVPSFSTTTGTVVGNSIFATTYGGGYSYTTQCPRVFYATQVNMDLEGPAAWRVVGIEPPRLECE